MYFIEILILIFLLVKISNLSSEISKIKRDIQALSGLQKSPVSSVGVQGGDIQNAYPKVEANPLMSPTEILGNSGTFLPKYEPVQETAFEKWFKENWLLKVGVLMILVGFGWFISYAFVHNWIGPVGRVALGFIIGSVITLIGTLRLSKDDISGTMLLVLGSAIVVITSYASQVVYNFFSSGVSLAIPFIVSVYLTTVGMVYNKSKIAVYAVLIGLLAPIFTHNQAWFDLNLLYTYLGVIAVGSVWVASVKNWRHINAISLLGTLLYTAPRLFSYYGGYREDVFVLVMIFALAVLYFIVSVAGIIKSQKDTAQADLLVAVFNAFLIIGTTMTFVPEEIRSLTLAVWMLVFAFGSFFVFSKTQKENFFYLYSLIAVMFLAVATSAELDGASLIITFAFESAIISIASCLLTRSRRVGYRMSLLMVGPALMALPSFYTNSWQGEVLNKDFFVIFTVGTLAMLLGFAYYLLRNEPSSTADADLPKAYIAQIIAGSFFLLGLLWVSLQAVFVDDSVAIIYSMIIYTIIGLSSYFRGVFSSNLNIKGYGSTILILVVIRLILVDVWSMPLALRIVMFIVIGILFISTAFITKKNKTINA